MQRIDKSLFTSLDMTQDGVVNKFEYAVGMLLQLGKLDYDKDLAPYFATFDLIASRRASSGGALTFDDFTRHFDERHELFEGTFAMLERRVGPEMVAMKIKMESQTKQQKAEMAHMAARSNKVAPHSNNIQHGHGQNNASPSWAPPTKMAHAVDSGFPGGAAHTFDAGPPPPAISPPAPPAQAASPPPPLGSPAGGPPSPSALHANVQQHAHEVQAHAPQQAYAMGKPVGGPHVDGANAAQLRKPGAGKSSGNHAMNHSPPPRTENGASRPLPPPPIGNP
jgi:hypothetical protein